MEILLTGSTGHLSQTLLKKISQDHEVYALIRRPTIPSITGENIHYLYGDLRDFNSLESLFKALKKPEEAVVIHTAAMISIESEMTDTLYDINVKGVQYMVALAKKYRIKRFMHVSSIHAIKEEEKGVLVTEPSSYSPQWVEGAYAKTKAIAAQYVLSEISEDFDGVILLPSGIIGPNDEGDNHLIQLILSHMLLKLPAMVPGGYDFVDVRDVADGILAAIEKGKKGESYILSGSYASVKDLLGWVSDRRIPMIDLSLAKMGLPFIGLYARIKKTRPLYTSYSLYTLNSNSHFSHEKATRELGYHPRPLKETVTDTVDYLKKQIEEKRI